MVTTMMMGYDPPRALRVDDAGDGTFTLAVTNMPEGDIVKMTMGYDPPRDLQVEDMGDGTFTLVVSGITSGGGGGITEEAFAEKTRDTSYDIHVDFSPTPPEDGLDGDVYTPDGGTFYIRTDGEWEPIAIEDLSPYLETSSGLALGDKAEAVRGGGAIGPVHVKTGSKLAIGYPVLWLEPGATGVSAIVMRGEDQVLYQLTINAGAFVIGTVGGTPEVVLAEEDV